MAEIATFERVLWGFSILLKWGLVGLFVFRKHYRSFPCFFHLRRAYGDTEPGALRELRCVGI